MRAKAANVIYALAGVALARLRSSQRPQLTSGPGSVRLRPIDLA
jgi:hypothetical protein